MSDTRPSEGSNIRSARSASRHSRTVSPSSRLPQTVTSTSQAGGDPDLPADPAPESESDESASEEGVSEPEPTLPGRTASPDTLPSAPPIPVVRDTASGLPPAPELPSPPRGRSRTRSPRSPPSGQPQPPPLPPGHSPSPPPPIMSSPASPPDKETLKHLLPLRYDGKTVIECNRFISQLLIYWAVNTTLSTIELKIQLAAVQVKIPGAKTPFANEATFLMALKARFSNLNDAAAAQVELSNLCADKSLCEKCTAAEFPALFKGPADRSGYGDLELRDKYLSGIPSRVYRKIELETFTTWEDADKHATEVEQQLDLEDEDVVGHVVVHPARKALQPASMWPSEKVTSPASALAVGRRGTNASSAPIAATSTPIASSSASTSAATAKSEQSELADLIAQMKSMREELEHYWAMKEESFSSGLRFVPHASGHVVTMCTMYWRLQMCTNWTMGPSIFTFQCTSKEKDGTRI
ncbi:hypothetical protein IEO21_10438 [Rhodonia placenta]|uniref:Uncharacterized protein n=1 Tax=Rhodonia placenta TaxID=104341 RepID=A0A8H7NST7_9APHY|nr:hypothetical protein IEO21_10438 [Postia placenta]